MANFGTTSLKLDLAIRRGDELLVEGWLRQVFVDAKTWQKTPIPDWVREALEPFTPAAARTPGRDEPQRVDAGRRARSSSVTDAQPSPVGPPAASSSCQRATWRSISSRATVRPRARWPASALARSACRSTRCAGRPRRRASSAIVRRAKGCVPREWITAGRPPAIAAAIRA